MLTRAQMVEQLAALAGPLGPFTSIDQREAEQADWHRSLSKEAAPILAELLYSSPLEHERAPASAEYFEMEAVEALAAIAKSDRDWLYGFAARQFFQHGPNAGLFELLGTIGGERAVSILVDVSASNELSDEALLSLVCALGEIGGEPAMEHLEKLRRQLDPDDTELLREISIAMGNTNDS